MATYYNPISHTWHIEQPKKTDTKPTSAVSTETVEAKPAIPVQQMSWKEKMKKAMKF